MMQPKNSSTRSNLFKINKLEFLHGLIIAIITAVITELYYNIQMGTDIFSKESLSKSFTVAITATLAYFVNTLSLNSEGKVLKKEKK